MGGTQRPPRDLRPEGLLRGSQEGNTGAAEGALLAAAPSQSAPGSGRTEAGETYGA